MKRKRVGKKINPRRLVKAFIILAFCSTGLNGCMKVQDDLPTVPSFTPSTESALTVEPSRVSTNAPAENPADYGSSLNAIKEDLALKSRNTIQKELAFIYNDDVVGISDIVDDEKLESVLGEAEGIKSHTYSHDDGLNMDTLIGFTEKQYQLPGLEIKTINAAKDDRFAIFQIEITDSSYSTIRNIKVGDSAKKLKEAYPEGNMVGNGEPNEEDVFQYLPENYVEGIKFRIKNGTIQSILLYKLLD